MESAQAAGGLEVDLKIDICRGDLQTMHGLSWGLVPQLVIPSVEGLRIRIPWRLVCKQVPSPGPCAFQPADLGLAPGGSDLSLFLGDADTNSVPWPVT